MTSRRLLAYSTACLCSWGVVQAQAVSFTYDALGRLTQVQTPSASGGVITQNFQYDPAGNRATYQRLLPVVLSMTRPIVNLTPSGATLTVDLSNPSATGTVTFTENGNPLAGPVSVSDGKATVIIEGLSKGTQTITATYSGDASDAPQATTFTINVEDLSWLPAVLQLLLQ